MILPDPSPAFSNRIAAIRERIAAAARRAGRDPASVTLVAVSKTFPVQSILEARACGQLDFGESRLQEAMPKIEAVDDPEIRWHLIGHLQTNKVNAAAGRFALIHSVDSARLIEALQRRAGMLEVRQPILLQINVSGEAVKSGAAPAEIPALIAAIEQAPNLECQGLMTIPPLSDDPEASRPHFAKLRELLAALPASANIAARHLSMGMSGDFEVAIEEGATLVRVGSAIFGGRG